MLHISGYLHWLASLFVFKALEFSTYWILMVRTSFNFSNFHYKFQIFTIGTSSWIWLQIQILCHFKLQVNDDRITWHASEEPIFSIISFWSSKTRIKGFQYSVCKFWYLYFECWNLGLMFISTTNLWDITLLRGMSSFGLEVMDDFVIGRCNTSWEAFGDVSRAVGTMCRSCFWGATILKYRRRLKLSCVFQQCLFTCKILFNLFFLLVEKQNKKKRKSYGYLFYSLMKKTVSVYRNKLWCVRPYLEASMQPPFNIIWSNLIQLILLVWIYLNSWVTLSFQKTSLFELCIIVFSYHWLAIPDKPAKFVCSTALLLA